MLVPAAAWLSPWDGAELLLSASTVPMPQRTWLCKQLLQEGHDIRYPLSLATPLPFLCFLDCVTAPPLDFCVAWGSRRAGRAQTMSCCLGCVSPVEENKELSQGQCWAVTVLVPALPEHNGSIPLNCPKKEQ